MFIQALGRRENEQTPRKEKKGTIRDKLTCFCPDFLLILPTFSSLSPCEALCQQRIPQVKRNNVSFTPRIEVRM